MRIDVWLPTANPFATPEVLAAVAAQAQAHDIATLWVGEHVVLFEDYASAYPYATDGRLPIGTDSGLLDPLITLSFLASITTTVRLGTAMVLLPQRNPVYCAKEVASLDWLSSGRVDFGVGVGWLKEEFDALSVPFARRGARTDEYLELLEVLWTSDPSSFSGEFYELASCSMQPKPIQHPRPPIHIGGESAAALARAARFEGWHSFNRRPEDLADPLLVLTKELEALGRRREELRVTVCPYMQPVDADAISRYADAGVDAVSCLLFPLSVDQVDEAFGSLAPLIDAANTA